MGTLVTYLQFNYNHRMSQRPHWHIKLELSLLVTYTSPSLLKRVQ